jgi:hypothetical protein
LIFFGGFIFHFTTKSAKKLFLKERKKILDILPDKCNNARRFLRKFTITGGLMPFKKLLLSFLFALLVSSPVFANHEVEPLFKTDNAECSIWGYASFTGGTKQDFMANPIRLRTSCKYKNFSFFMENDISGLDNRIHPNYITQAWVGYNFGKEGLVGNMFSDTTVRAGSVLTAGGLYLPPAYLAITIGSPSNPFHHYGYGVQLQTKITPSLTFIADVTGPTGPSFNDPQRFNGMETSQRLVWDVKKNLQLSISNQKSDISQRTGVGVKYSPTENLDLYGGGYRAKEEARSEKPGTTVGGYGLADYKVWGMKDNKLDLRVHGMVEKTSGATNYTGVTAGTSLVLPENGPYGRLGGSSVTVDLLHSETKPNDGPKIEDDVVGIRVRVFF